MPAESVPVLRLPLISFTNPDGTAGTPYGNQIENPTPVRGSNNYYTQDGYGGGSYVNCADDRQPGGASGRGGPRPPRADHRAGRDH